MKLLDFLMEWLLHFLWLPIGLIVTVIENLKEWFVSRPIWHNCESGWQLLGIDQPHILKQAQALAGATKGEKGNVGH